MLTRQQIERFENSLAGAIRPLSSSEDHLSFNVDINGMVIKVSKFFVSYDPSDFLCTIVISKSANKKKMHEVADLFPYVPFSGKPYFHGHPCHLNVSSTDPDKVIQDVLDILDKIKDK